MKRAILGFLTVLLMGVPAAAGCLDDYRPPDFAAYLRDANLTALYRTELRTLCLEEGDLCSCFEYGRLYEEDAIGDRRPTLTDSVTWNETRRRISTDLVRAGLRLRFGQYREALEILDEVIDRLPDRDLLAEAVLARAQCYYYLDRVDEALSALRSVRPLLPEDRDRDLALYLGLCEEKKGNLVDAESLIREAENGGSSEAVFHLLRLKLKQDDLEAFNVIAEEVAGTGWKRSYPYISPLAAKVEMALPEAWHTLMLPVVSDTGFTAGDHPEVVGSILRLAESGENMEPYCQRLLSRPIEPGRADSLRYALALSLRDTSLCDTLAALFLSVSDRDLKVRCLASCLAYANGERGAMAVNRVLTHMGGIWRDLTAGETLELAGRLVEFERGDLCRDHLVGLLDGLEIGRDDAALLAVGDALAGAGDEDKALSLYMNLARSPVPSGHTREADRAAYLLKATGRHSGDMADVVERVAEEGLDPVELGDLFMERLKDYGRAAASYRRALPDLPEGVPAERVEIKLAEALAARAVKSGDGAPRAEAMDLVAGLADTSIVPADDVLRVLKLSTAWLREERGRAFDIIKSMGRRDDISSGDLYQMARMLFHLFSRRDGNIFAQCILTLRRLASEYPTSEEAPLAAFLAARIRFLAGDYVGALEAYEACREVWRKHEVTRLCDEGIGDCYLYSGGVEEAIGRYGDLGPSPGVALKMAQCYEILDRPDSALRYYDLSENVFSPSLSKPLCLRRGLLVYERDGLEAALVSLDSPLASIRDLRAPARAALEGYALCEAGYRRLGTGLLEGVAAEDGDIGCDALLLLSSLKPDEDDGFPREQLDEGEDLCKSIFGALRLLYERAYLACSLGSLEECIEERDLYSRRFPLDRISRLRFGVHEALARYRLGDGETATAIIDSLVSGDRRDDALVYGLYRQGIHHMVKADYASAARAFHTIESDYSGSELFYDTVFKLGTVYYMLDKYDSSAIFFEMATGADKPSLVEDAYFNLGLALEEAGALEEASEAFRSHAVRFPFSERFERALMRAAYTGEQAGRPEQAIAIYEDLLGYTQDPETASEALYWIGESYAEMGEPLRAACEFMRVVHLFPKGGPWTGTAAFRAGMECEKAGLADHALIVYRENVDRFGTGTDWGRASRERLDVLESSESDSLRTPERPSGEAGTETGSAPAP